MKIIENKMGNVKQKRSNNKYEKYNRKEYDLI